RRCCRVTLPFTGSRTARLGGGTILTRLSGFGDGNLLGCDVGSILRSLCGSIAAPAPERGTQFAARPPGLCHPNRRLTLCGGCGRHIGTFGDGSRRFVHVSHLLSDTP